MFRHGRRHHRRRRPKEQDDDDILVCPLSARSIVFRDHFKRAAHTMDYLDVDDDDDGTTEGIDDDGSCSNSSSSSSLGSDSDDEDDVVMSSRDPNLPLPSSLRHRMGGIGPRQDSIRHLDQVKEGISEEIQHLAESMVPALSAHLPELSSRLIDSQTLTIHNFPPKRTRIKPLPNLELNPDDLFAPLLEESSDAGANGKASSEWTVAEQEVFELLKNQQACVKTIKNTRSEMTDFLNHFQVAEKSQRFGTRVLPSQHDDIAPNDAAGYPFTSFVTSTSLLPELGKKMRCYGSITAYSIGFVFALPQFESPKEEDDAAKRTKTWSWPAGYAAKTEYNIDSCGNLINGREQALVPLSKMREYNDEYVYKQNYWVGEKRTSGFSVVPYNEVFLRVGGPSRYGSCRPSYSRGVGLPVALFVRTNTMRDLMALFRTRARMSHVLGKQHTEGIPLLFVAPELGVRVFTMPLQQRFLKLAATKLNPFQNQHLERQTRIDNTNETCLQQKIEEFLDLDKCLRKYLTHKDSAHIAGGFGMADESQIMVLKDATILDKQQQRQKNGGSCHKLQDDVIDGLSYAVRSGDYYTARQILILYTVVAVKGDKSDLDCSSLLKGSTAATYSDLTILKTKNPPLLLTSLPPPLDIDTDRLRSATNLDGILVVLGAAQILKSINEGSAKLRTEESFEAVEEWIELGEKSMSFRVASWHDQLAAQDDAHVASDHDSIFLAFLSNKAINNRKRFVQQLRQAALSKTDNFSGASFLRAIYNIINNMHSPSLRLELLQYVLGLDNRYSVSLVKQSIELAATCMSIATV